MDTTICLENPCQSEPVVIKHGSRVQLKENKKKTDEWKENKFFKPTTDGMIQVVIGWDGKVIFIRYGSQLV